MLQDSTPTWGSESTRPTSEYGPMAAVHRLYTSVTPPNTKHSARSNSPLNTPPHLTQQWLTHQHTSHSSGHTTTPHTAVADIEVRWWLTTGERGAMGRTLEGIRSGNITSRRSNNNDRINKLLENTGIFKVQLFLLSTKTITLHHQIVKSVLGDIWPPYYKDAFF